MTYVATRLPAKALRAIGFEVIDLGLAAPDFPTPAHVAEAAHRAAPTSAKAT